MTKTTIFSVTAMAGAMALSTAMATAMAPVPAQAADMEKCYGVVKAGHNDCGANGHSCAGAAATDGDANEWVMIPAGLCDRLVGGSTTPGGDSMAKDAMDKDTMDEE